MTEAEVRALFTLSGIPILNLWQLQNGYGGSVLYSYAKAVRPIRVYIEGSTLLDRAELDFLNVALPAALSPWWLVKTSRGLIKIGWRKRVISIDWSDTDIRLLVTSDDVTKEETLVHAWSVEKAVQYLKTLAVHLPVPQSSTSVDS